MFGDIAKVFCARYTCGAFCVQCGEWWEARINDLISSSHNLHVAMSASGMLDSPHSPNLFCLLIQAQSVYAIITRSSLCFSTTVSISRFSHKSARSCVGVTNCSQHHTPRTQTAITISNPMLQLEDKETQIEWLTHTLTIINNLARWPKYFLRDAWSIGAAVWIIFICAHRESKKQISKIVSFCVIREWISRFPSVQKWKRSHWL